LHLGVYPDGIKEWHSKNCEMLGVQAATKLTIVWLQIKGLLFLHLNVMQGLIKEKLDQVKKELLEQYPKMEAEKKTETKKCQ
jgi:hypothetical protein